MITIITTVSVFILTHASCIAEGMGRAFSRVCLFVCTLKRKRLKLATPNLIQVYSVAVAWHALTQRSKGQSHGHMVMKTGSHGC